MENLRRLLELTESSGLARTARLCLVGLKASMKEAMRNAGPDDPGLGPGAAWLAELESLAPDAQAQPELEAAPDVRTSVWREQEEHGLTVSSQSTTGAVSESDTGTVAQEGQSFRLEELRDAFLADGELKKFLGNLRLHSTTDAELWTELHLALLRVPEALAKQWQERALNAASKVGASPDKTNLTALPSNRKELLWPGLSGSIKAAGLCFSTDVGLSARLEDDGKFDEDVRFLAQIITACLSLIEMDRSLHHALMSVYRFGITPLKSSQRTLFEAALLERFQRAHAADTPVDVLTTRLDLDEAIHSLVHLPPAAANSSWWAKLLEESRRTLDNAANLARKDQKSVQIRWLSGPYSDVKDVTSNNLKLNEGGAPGEILVCLRPYAKIDGQELKGRVIYRSLEKF